MSSSQALYLKSGEQPRAFLFGNQQVSSPFATANQASLPIYKESPFGTFQAILTATGAGTATIAIQGSNDDNTGRGFIPPGKDQPGFAVAITSGSPTMLSAANQFTAALVGALVSGVGIPVGTTVLTYNSAGSVTLSANATLTVANEQVWIYANNWCTTPLTTITLAAVGTDGAAVPAAPWRYVRASLTNVTGAGATVNILMGV